MKIHRSRLGLPKNLCTRRTALRDMAVASLLGAAWPLAGQCWAAAPRGRIKQSVCLWCFEGYLPHYKMNLDQFAAACAKMGLKGMETTSTKPWPTLVKNGLICALWPAHDVYKGLNRPANHDECLAAIRKCIDITAEAGFPTVAVFSGGRGGMDDQEGLDNCAIGLKKVAGHAEKKKVTLCLELLNTIDHADYMANSTKWCVQLVHKVGSPRVKILYDIYHAAMMKEDVPADIRNYGDCFGHYHTAGYPGRNEIDDSQRLDYPKIMQAILATGYKGYVGQEFNPKRADALKSLQQAVKICDV